MAATHVLTARMERYAAAFAAALEDPDRSLDLMTANRAAAGCIASVRPDLAADHLAMLVRRAMPLGASLTAGAVLARASTAAEGG